MLPIIPVHTDLSVEPGHPELGCPHQSAARKLAGQQFGMRNGLQGQHGGELATSHRKARVRPFGEEVRSHGLHQSGPVHPGHLVPGSLEKLSGVPIRGRRPGGTPTQHNTRVSTSATPAAKDDLPPTSGPVPQPLEVKFLEVHQGGGEPDKSKDLRASWAISPGRGGPTAHRIKTAGWDVPLDEWITLCGWAFARRNVKVTLADKKPFEAKQCIKCKEISILRDDVNGGVGGAGCVALAAQLR